MVSSLEVTIRGCEAGDLSRLESANVVYAIVDDGLLCMESLVVACMW